MAKVVTNQTFKLTVAFTPTLLLALSLILTACGVAAPPTEQDNDASLQAASLAAKQTVLEDLAAFDSQREIGSTLSIPNLYKNFQIAFNGFSGPDIRAYMDTRIHSFFTEYDVDHASVLFKNRLDEDTAKAVVGASNIGTIVWLQGVFENREISFVAAGQTVPALSSRVGIMQIGPGYDPVEQEADGSLFRYPREYRQTILIHEARHSDCTGGVPASAVAIARQSTDFHGFIEHFPQRNCGHMHAICPAWHELHGLPGCDDLPWGAYAIENLYESALFLNARARGDMALEKMMQFAASESAGRLLYIIDKNNPDHVPDISKLWAGKFGAPDMSSSGVINQ